MCKKQALIHTSKWPAMIVPQEGFSEITGQTHDWVNTGLAMALSLGRSFSEPAGPQSQRNTLRVSKMSCCSPFPARFVKGGLISLD